MTLQFHRENFSSILTNITIGIGPKPGMFNQDWLCVTFWLYFVILTVSLNRSVCLCLQYCVDIPNLLQYIHLIFAQDLGLCKNISSCTCIYCTILLKYLKCFWESTYCTFTKKIWFSIPLQFLKRNLLFKTFSTVSAYL